MSDKKELKELQLLLHQALSYFLYNTINQTSLYSQVYHSLSSMPLIRISERVCGISSIHALDITPRTKLNLVEFAKYLSSFYQLWDEIIPKGEVRSKLSIGKSYVRWLQDGGENTKYEQVHNLYLMLRNREEYFFHRALIHGSIATLDDTLGFSDLDTAFVVRAEVLKNPRKLLELRKLATDILILTYAFDPFMHHGPYYISEIDLAWYPEALFPSVLFRYGVELLDNSEEIEVRPRPSHDITDKQIDMFEEFFQNWSSKPFILKNSFELEWILGSAMLLPALYLQRKTEEFRYKRDTFPLAEKDFSPEEWEPIRTASELRNNLGPRPKPPRWLVGLAQKMRCPGLLQKWARYHPISVRRARETTKILGQDYTQHVLHLLNSMKSKLSQKTSYGATAHDRKKVLQHTKDPPILRYFNNISHGPFTDIPRAIPKEKYDAAIEMLVTYWSRLPQRPMAIYQIGKVSAPGISDLDFVLVFANDKTIDWNQFQPQSFPDWIQELMTHPPYCCTRELWADLSAWHPTFDLRYLWGDRLSAPKISEEFVSGCALGMLVDYLTVKVPRDFIWTAWERPLNVRLLLAMLHSFKYTLKLAEQAGFTVPESAWQTISQVDSLRGSWSEMNYSAQLEKLAQLCAEICDEAGRLITQVDIQLSQSIGKLGKHVPRVTCPCSNPSLLHFVTPWTFMDAMEFTFENYSRTGRIVWTSPFSFSQIFAVYADECPQLTRYLHAQGCKTKLQWDGNIWNDGLRYHARAMMTYAKSAYRLGVPPQKYIALGYSPPLSPWQYVQRPLIKLIKGEIGLREFIRKGIGKITKMVKL